MLPFLALQVPFPVALVPNRFPAIVPLAVGVAVKID